MVITYVQADHNVHLVESSAVDSGFFFVGKIFDRPLRSKREVMEFVYSNSALDDDESDGEEACTSFIDKAAAAATAPSHAGGKRVRFDWIPQNVPETLVT